MTIELKYYSNLALVTLRLSMYLRLNLGMMRSDAVNISDSYNVRRSRLITNVQLEKK